MVYLFEAHYTNEKTGRKTVRPIEFNGQDFDSERECYIYAMETAFDLMDDTDETLDSLVSVSC